MVNLPALGVRAASRRRGAAAPVGDGSPSLVALAKAVATATDSGVTSLAVTLGSAPTAGNLLVLNAYGSQATDLTVSGLTRVAFTAGPDAVAGLFAKVAVGGEWATWTVISDISGSCRVHLAEWVPGAGHTWNTGSLVATQGSKYANGYSGTVTGDVATTGPSFVVAAFSMGSAEFNRAWTGGFTWDTVVLNRLSVATKKSTAGETPTTSESWDTSRYWRGVMAAFRLT